MSTTKSDIQRKIKYCTTMRDYYSGNAKAKRNQQREINRLTKLLEVTQ
jgi:hypothetical protein